jgi:thiol-disulfide isomerase/thioredoxin
MKDMKGDIKELGVGNFDEGLRTDKLVIVEFYTNSCPNCVAIAPVYAKMSEEHELDAVFAKVNAQTHSELAVRYGVMGTPTFKFFCKGQPIGELVGAIPATMLRNTIKDYIRHRMECASKTTRITYEIDGYG